MALCKGLVFERQFSGDDLVKNHAQSVNIACFRRFIAAPQFRRHKLLRAAAFSGRLIAAAREPEISDDRAELTLIRRAEKNITALQITMHDPATVRLGNSGAKLVSNVECRGRTETAIFL